MSIHQGQWLKRTLRKRNIRQEDFAGALGVSRNTLIIWMKENELKLDARLAVLKQLNMTEDEMEQAMLHDESVQADQSGHHNAQHVNYKSGGDAQEDARQKLREYELRIQALETENALLKEINALLKGGGKA